MEPFRWQKGQPNHLGRFDDSRPAPGHPPPLGGARAMGRIYRVGGLDPGLKQAANYFAKAIAAVAQWEQIERVAWPGCAPAARYSLSGLRCSQRAFEFVGDDQDR